jgi:hypothetical protein
MVLRFTVLGYEIAKVTLDIEHADHAPNLAALAQQPRKFERAVEQGIKAVSKSWVKRMI